MANIDINWTQINSLNRQTASDAHAYTDAKEGTITEAYTQYADSKSEEARVNAVNQSSEQLSETEAQIKQYVVKQVDIGGGMYVQQVLAWSPTNGLSIRAADPTQPDLSPAAVRIHGQNGIAFYSLGSAEKKASINTEYMSIPRANINTVYIGQYSIEQTPDGALTIRKE